ncbi:MAG: hypothetical protein IH904_00585 [Proteobacteria bacterium]|nr:hypothetical protein [Pseudomonadota bacterium]
MKNNQGGSGEGSKGGANNSSEDALSRLSFEHPIPKAVREHGKALDPKVLESGDLILVSKKKKSWLSRQIQTYQSEMFAPEHACWHHAVVSGGRFEICEATLQGVRACEYWKYMTGEYDIKIRRLRNAPSDIRSQVAYYAATNVRTKYGFLNAFNIRRILISGDGWRRTMLWSKGVICSQLYFEACMRVGYLLATIPPENVCPAHLSLSPGMFDVPLSWVKV